MNISKSASGVCAARGSGRALEKVRTHSRTDGHHENMQLMSCREANRLPVLAPRRALASALPVACSLSAVVVAS